MLISVSQPQKPEAAWLQRRPRPAGSQGGTRGSGSKDARGPVASPAPVANGTSEPPARVFGLRQATCADIFLRVNRLKPSSMKPSPSFRLSFPMPILSSFATSSVPDNQLTWSRPPTNSSLKVIRSDKNTIGRRVTCLQRRRRSRRTVSNNLRLFRTEEDSSPTSAASSARATVLPVRCLHRQA